MPSTKYGETKLEVRLSINPVDGHQHEFQLEAMSVTSDHHNQTSLLFMYDITGIVDQTDQRCTPRTIPTCQNIHVQFGTALDSRYGKKTSVGQNEYTWDCTTSQLSPLGVPNKQSVSSSASSNQSAIATPDCDSETEEPRHVYRCPVGSHPQCDNCTFSGVTATKEHIIQHHTRPHYCPRCGDIFETNNDWSDHITKRSCVLNPNAMANVPGIPGDTMDRIIEWVPEPSLSEDENWEQLKNILRSG
ncbi:hypothetical protein QBC38DRAFT_149175 [Podospora fimiseda]|uniref:C2H2-type domain-containing protein n=1 Tax=Podospora fimiseda TaxID=252190 RepID=A0AAN7BEL7_9PEZI|nr:hypothetical protein QBC38DRAFT_149175 [Podospora fimiseda]